MPIFTRKPKPPIHCIPHHDSLPPDRQRACWAQPIPKTPRDQLAFLVALALNDVARLEPKSDPKVLYRRVIRDKASSYNVSRFTIRRHLRGRGPGPGYRLREALRYEIEGLFCPVRIADAAVQHARDEALAAKTRAERATYRAAERERSRIFHEALDHHFGE